MWRAVELLAPLAVAVLVSYITAVIALQTRTAVLEVREDGHYQELQRSIQNVQTELRVLRQELRDQALAAAERAARQ